MDIVKIGDLVVVTHPFIMDRHVLAKVETETKAMLGLRYFDRRVGEWGAEQKRRKRDCVTGILPADSDLQAVSDRLLQLGEALLAAEREARSAYAACVRVVAWGNAV